MYRLAICDDEQHVCEELREMILGEYQNRIEIECVNSIESYLSELAEGIRKVPDIAIMDIQWDKAEQNGIDVTIQLQQAYPGIKIIFLTGYMEYATDIFMAKPSYFLVKPIQVEKLKSALEKTMQEIDAEKDTRIVLHISGDVLNLIPADILYVESNKHELLIHCVDGQKHVWMKMDDFLKQTDGIFIRIHQSFAINPRYVKRFSMKDVLMADGRSVAVSRKRFKDAKEQFLDYLEMRE